MLKKEINLKDACKLYLNLSYAKNSLGWEIQHRRAMGDLCSEENDALVAKARAKKDKAQAEFNESAQAALGQVLTETQRRCSARTVTADQVVAKLIDIEDDLKISKKAMDGVTVTMDLNAQSFPSAYKGIPESTIVRARYKSGSWRVTDVYRGNTFRPTVAIRLVLTDAAKQALIDRFTTQSI